MWILDVLILSWLFAGVFKTIKSGNALNPFNRSATIPLRGILAIMIIIHHFPVWYPKEYACINVADGWGGAICSLFFLLSGYGLTKSYLTKGDVYLKGFLSRRLPKIAIPACVVLVIHLFVRFLVGGGTFDVLIIDLSNLSIIFSHYWFIYTLFIFYLIFYLSFRIFRNAVYGIVFICIAAIIYYYTTKDILHYTENWWNSIHGIAIGSIIANIEPKVKPWLENNKVTYRFLMSFIILIVCAYNFIGCYIHYLPAWGTVFFFLLPFMVYVCNSFVSLPQCRTLNFLGGISLEIYLVHKSVMDMLHPFVTSAHVFFVSVILLSIVFAWTLKKVTYK
jgi:peptidoglycan/LPS O-acetylase OafA/YrhL